MLEPSTLDPLHRLLPAGCDALRDRVGARFRVTFVVDAATDLADEARPSRSAAATLHEDGNLSLGAARRPELAS